MKQAGSDSITHLDNSFSGDMQDALLLEESTTVEEALRTVFPDGPFRMNALTSLDAAQEEIRGKYHSFLDPGTAAKILANLGPEEARYYLSRAVSELDQNTPYFRESAALRVHGIKLGDDEVPFLFYADPTGLAARFLRRGEDRGSRLLPPLTTGVVFDRCPSEVNILESLLTKGTLPPCLNRADVVAEAAETYSIGEKMLLWAPLAARFALVALITRGLGPLTGVGANAATFPAAIPFMRSIFGSNALRETYALAVASNSPTWGYDFDDEASSLSAIAKATKEDGTLLKRAFKAIEFLELLYGDDAALHATHKVIREPSVDAVKNLETQVNEDLENIGVKTPSQRDIYRAALIHLHDVETRALRGAASETVAKVLLNNE